MTKQLLVAILFALAIVTPVPTMAAVNFSFGISLPPLIRFEVAPDVIVMPDTSGVYVVPDIEDDMYFWNGWWWRPWEGRWYRSRYFSRGWTYYDSTPSFYFDVDPGWRSYYRDRSWSGHRWDYKRIPNRQLRQNWKGWNNNRHWEKQRTWGVHDYQPRPVNQRKELRNQRQQQYQQRPEVQRHQQQRQEPQRQGQQNKQKQEQRQHAQPQQRQPEQQRQPHPQQQRQPEARQPQRQQPQEQRPQSRGKHHEESQREQSEGRSEGGNREQRR